MKTCTLCKVEKQLTEFYKDSKNRDGRNSNCKECTKKQTYDKYERTKKDPVAYKKHLEKSAEYKRIKYRERCINRNKEDYEDL